MTINVNKGVYGLKTSNKAVLGIMLVFMVGIMFQATATANTVGYVDFEFLFNTHPEYDVKNKELQDAAERLTEEFQAKAENLESQEEIQALIDYYELQLELLADELRTSIVTFVREIIAEVAAENGVTVVVPEGIIIVGGVDLTPQVLEAMYRSYGISVPSNLRNIK